MSACVLCYNEAMSDERLIFASRFGDLIWVKGRKRESISFEPERKTYSLPVIPDRLQGDLRNVAAYIASTLNEENPNIFKEIDTSNPDLISERTPEDSLKILLSLRGAEIENLSLRIVKDFGAGGMSVNEKLNLAEKVEHLLEKISPKD